MNYRRAAFKLPLKVWIFGGWHLFKFGWSIRFNFKHPYLLWRLETIFADAKFHWTWYYLYRMLCYGYWAHTQKKESTR